MSWRDRLRPASIRGVAFKVISEDAEFGRRRQVLRFPGRREVIVQDFGREADQFSITAYVIGADYDRDRDRLEAALLEPGPAKLVLPWRGEVTVEVLPPIRTHRGTREGGFATISFSVVVVRPQDARIVAARPDAKVQVAEANFRLQAAVRDDFVSSFDVGGLPSAFRSSSIGAINDAAGRIRQAHGQIAARLAVVDQLSSAIDDFTSAAVQLVTTPERLFGSLQSLAATMLSSVLAIGAAARRQIPMAMRAAENLSGFADGYSSLPSNTPRRRREARNRDAIVRATRASTAGSTAATIAEIPPASYSQAIAVRTDLARLIEGAAEDAPDAVFEALAELRAAMSDHLEQAARPLPELAEYTPRAEMPAILVAHLLYGDARRESDIVARNDLAEPGLIQVDMPLEVASG